MTLRSIFINSIEFPDIQEIQLDERITVIVSGTDDGADTMLLNAIRESTLNLNLIDKIESGCHPSQHRYLISNLLKNDPVSQFVVTTWSPLVLSSVENKRIRHLHDRKIYKAECYGWNSTYIYNDIFGIKEHPDFIEEKLNEFHESLCEGREDMNTALRLFQELEATLGNEYPEISYLRSLLDFNFDIAI